MTYMTEERLILKEMVAKFTDDVVLPTANKLDPVKGMIPQDLIDQMSELGLFGITAPEELGGSGLGAMEYCLVAEELARGWMSVASMIATVQCQGVSGNATGLAGREHDQDCQWPVYAGGWLV